MAKGRSCVPRQQRCNEDDAKTFKSLLPLREVVELDKNHPTLTQHLEPRPCRFRW